MKQLKNILLIVFGIIIVILLFKYCSGKGGEVVIKETIKYDTVYKELKGDTTFIPVIRNHYLKGENKVFEKWDTLYWVEPTDTAAILRDYYSYNTYSDTLPITWKDANDTLIWSWVGDAVISDTISRNRILNRKFSYNIQWPEITKTVTKTVLDKRVQLYAEFSLLGNTKDLASGIDAGLLLKTKNDRMVGIGYETLFNGGSYFKLKYAHKISFRKH